MKNFKLAIFSIAMVLLVFTSCTNEETIVDPQQNTEESESVTTTFNELSRQFDQNGNLNSDNPAGNVVFDFCFDFVYPLDLSFNNGTTVTANSLDDIIELIISSTDELYVNGIAFPFNVETYNESTNAIEIATINNEDDFVALLDSCDFDEVEDCICTQEANPVCVEITDPNGESFIITYPNACYAECDGFTEDDFVDNCEDDYNCPGGNGCFEFNFPISIITDNDETITINSQQELDSAVYDNYYFDFVYPFDVTTLEDQEVVTISSQEDFEAVLEDCFGDINGGDCEECEDAGVDPVCVEYTNTNGETEIVTFPNACYAECSGFSQEDFVDCEDDTNPSNCSEEGISNSLVECVWFATSSLNQNNNSGVFTFNADGTVSVSIEGNTITGTWSLSSNPSTGEVFMSLSLPEPYEGVSSLDWTFTECGEYYIGLESNNEFLGFESSCD